MVDEELERMIDEAGREAVFQRARDLGYGSTPPDRWLWRQIVADVKAGRPSGMPPKRLGEALFGFRL